MRRFLCVGVLVAIGARAGSAAPYNEIVAFGDSLTDTGNVFALSNEIFPPPGFGYDNGRFSNGSLWVEHLADRLGKKVNQLLPAFSSDGTLSGGTNFAFGGVGTGGGFTDEGLPNMSTQVSIYLNSVNFAVPSPNKTLFVLWGGANDFIRSGQQNVMTPASNIAADIATLAQAGAKWFLVPNLPKLGETPAALGTADNQPFPELFNPLELFAPAIQASLPPEERRQKFNDLSVTFNTALNDALDDLESTVLPDQGIHNVKIKRFDVATLADDVLVNFTGNVTNPYLFDGVFDPDVDPDDLVFFDPIHLTATIHEILGEAAYHLFDEDQQGGQLQLAANVVLTPEPASLAIVTFGSLLFVSRRHSAA